MHDDITKLPIDAIVNAAKSSLRGGSGVDGAIHAAAGPLLLDECIQIGGCMTGDAKVSQAYNLPCKHVIHTVGPVWFDGKSNEQQDLVDCYKNSLILAEGLQAKQIAFPCISTGGYGFPGALASQIAYETVSNFPAKYVQEVIFCCFTEKDYKLYKKIMEPGFFKRMIKKI